MRHSNFYSGECRTFEAVLLSSLLFGLVHSVPVPASPSNSVNNIVDPHKTLDVDFVDDNHSPDFNDADYGLEMINEDDPDQPQKNVSVWAATSIPFLLTIIGVILWCCCVYLRCQAEDLDEFKNLRKAAYARIQYP